MSKLRQNDQLYFDLIPSVQKAPSRPLSKLKARKKTAAKLVGLPPVYLTIGQVMARYGVSRSTIYRWLKTCPAFPKPIQIGQNSPRWSLADLQAYEAKAPKGTKRT